MQISFPKGCGEPNISPEDNAKDELRDELSCPNPEVRYIGKISPDCGITSNQIHVLESDISECNIPMGYEGIEGYVLLEETELNEMIGNGRITDATSISAYCMSKYYK